VLKKALSLQAPDRHATALALAEELDAFVTASGLEPPQARLSLMMNTVFAEYRKRKDEAVKRAQGLALARNPRSDDSPEDVSSLIVARSRPPRGRPKTAPGQGEVRVHPHRHAQQEALMKRSRKGSAKKWFCRSAPPNHLRRSRKRYPSTNRPSDVDCGGSVCPPCDSHTEAQLGFRCCQ